MQAFDQNAGMACTGFQGRGRGQGGMGLGRSCRQLICYNCRGLGHYTRYCTNPMRISCSYYESFDHEMIDCPTLIAQMHEKGVLQPNQTQNIQMMRSKPREEDPNVNMVL